MNKIWISLIATAVACLTVARAAPDGQPDADASTVRTKPNFIVILADDLGYGDLGCYGSDRIKTPHIDRLAVEGMKFTDFYATAPICTPTRASLMTGRYPSRVGLGAPLHTPDKIGLHEDEITLAELLKSQGYATACIGKWHLGHQAEFYPTRHGFDDFYGTPLGHCFATESMRKKAKFSDLFLRNEEKVPSPPIGDLTEVLTAEAVKWIKDKKEDPFFLFLSHPMPHGPVAASGRFRGKSAGGLYGDAVETIDWSTGEILKTIEDLGLLHDTIVVFTSDNGACTNAWGTKATWFGSNAPFRGKKQQGWEGGLRVPCVMWGPGRIPAGSVCSELATVMDFLPTFGAMAGAELPADRVIDGKDITPLMLAEKDAKTPYDAFVYHVRFGRRSGVRMGDWKLIIDVDAQTWKHEGTALYNLKKDPGEAKNRAAEYPHKVGELRARLDAFERELQKAERPAVSNREKPNVIILFADGRDVSALLLGMPDGGPTSKPFFFCWERELRAVREGRWKLQLPHVDMQAPDPAGIGHGGVRGKVTEVSRALALYDLQADPGEACNVAAQHPDKVRKLRALPETFEKDLGQTTRPAGSRKPQRQGMNDRKNVNTECPK